MHTDDGWLSLHFVFQLVARFDPQSLSNFVGNGRLPLTRHWWNVKSLFPYARIYPYACIIAYLIPVGRLFFDDEVL